MKDYLVGRYIYIMMKGLNTPSLYLCRPDDIQLAVDMISIHFAFGPTFEKTHYFSI